MLSHLSNTRKGILFALAGYTGFAMSDVCAKWLTQHYSSYQVIVMDTAFASLIFLCLSPFIGGWRSIFDKKGRKIHLLRMGLNTAINFMVVYLFTQMPLSTLYAMLFTKPFFAALLAVFLYGQKLVSTRVIAIIVGFAGVLIAMRPDSGIEPVMLLSLLCAFTIALMFLISRSLEGASIFSLGFLPMIASCLLTLPFALPGFEPIEPLHFVPVVLSGIFMSIGIIGVSLAFRTAAAAAVSPFLYTEMIWALGLGFVIFGDLPDIWMLAGAAIIIASGIYLLETERRAENKAPVQ